MRNGVKKEILKKDRITDAIQLTEAAYCVTFVSNDTYLVNKYGKRINPDIELLLTSDFLNHLDC